jgi:hypothetical protein
MTAVIDDPQADVRRADQAITLVTNRLAEVDPAMRPELHAAEARTGKPVPICWPSA